ncbi:hypothetical protein F0562_029675 [Nyssa sinensis]|uniref:Uncharacterized protein n=1 Tax=Nyssa sinensis TaxID=561372 RepID=A0A5J5B1R1_9ASTE|nr:hypothetical protein F0562_029675 [Nyssa sinensis]
MLDTPTDEGSALAVVKPPSPNKFKGLNSNNENKGEMYKPRINKEDLWCNYCKKPRHTKEMCWKLKGKTSFGKNNTIQQRYAPWGSQENVALVDDKPIQDSTSSSSEMGDGRNILAPAETEKTLDEKASSDWYYLAITSVFKKKKV